MRGIESNVRLATGVENGIPFFTVYGLSKPQIPRTINSIILKKEAASLIGVGLAASLQNLGAARFGETFLGQVNHAEHAMRSLSVVALTNR